MNWKSFISFERMVTPVIIKVLFWFGMVACVSSSSSAGSSRASPTVNLEPLSAHFLAVRWQPSWAFW